MSNRFIMGLVRAMVMPAFFSRRTSSPLTRAKCSFSKSVLDSALMTRMPEAVSRTVRTMESTPCCKDTYRGMPRLDTQYTSTARKGRVHTSTRVSTGSRVRVMRMPPSRRMGARTPMRCIMPIIWWTL